MCEDCGFKHASFGAAADRKMRWCGSCVKANGHKEGTVYLMASGRMCEDCHDKIAAWGISGQKKRRWCGGCVKKNMHTEAVILGAKMCEDCGKKNAGFGYDHDRKKRWCGGCAKSNGHVGAVNVTRRSLCEDCPHPKKSASYGLESDPEMKRRWCSGCAAGNPGAISMVGRKKAAAQQQAAIATATTSVSTVQATTAPAHPGRPQPISSGMVSSGQPHYNGQVKEHGTVAATHQPVQQVSAQLAAPLLGLPPDNSTPTGMPLVAQVPQVQHRQMQQMQQIHQMQQQMQPLRQMQQMHQLHQLHQLRPVQQLQPMPGLHRQQQVVHTTATINPTATGLAVQAMPAVTYDYAAALPNAIATMQNHHLHPTTTATATHNGTMMAAAPPVTVALPTDASMMASITTASAVAAPAAMGEPVSHTSILVQPPQEPAPPLH